MTGFSRIGESVFKGVVRLSQLGAAKGLCREYLIHVIPFMLERPCLA
jgi:hypothetical protein